MEKDALFNKVLQVAVVVKDLMRSVRIYNDEYGIGPWLIYEFNPETVKDMIINEKRIDYAMKLAVCDIDGVQWELIQPLDNKSIYAEFLEKHGEGLHHIAFGTPDYKKTLDTLKKRNKKILQGGNWKGLTYTYLSTDDDLGVIAEIYNISKDFKWPEPEDKYPKE